MKKVTQNLQKLPDSTPACAVAFLGGVLPGTAAIHLKQLNMFGMIVRATDSVLHKHAIQVLTSSSQSAASWFLHIGDLSIMYDLPHPLECLQNSQSQISYNKKIKSKIINFWEQKLRKEAAELPSLKFLNTNFMFTKPLLL